MLQLKSKLKEVNQVPVVVAYLGFCASLELSGFERKFIRNTFRSGAEWVLACRLGAATMISMVTRLPQYKMVYNDIPTAEASKQLILDHSGGNSRKPFCIVAGA
jgi:hypothetical protein